MAPKPNSPNYIFDYIALHYTRVCEPGTIHNGTLHAVGKQGVGKAGDDTCQAFTVTLVCTAGGIPLIFTNDNKQIRRDSKFFI